MRSYLWGRPGWVWIADVAIVVGFGATALLSPVPAVRLLLGAVVLLRIVLAAVVTLMWRALQRAAAASTGATRIDRTAR